jgi:hypothetical protein
MAVFAVFGVAHASTVPHHLTPHTLNTAYCYKVTNVGDGGLLWFNGSTQTWQTKTVASGHWTGICPSAADGNGSQEFEDQNSGTQCMNYYDSGTLGNDIVSELLCNGHNYEYFNFYAAGDGNSIVSNEWVTANGPSCSGGFINVMSSTGVTGSNVTFNCPRPNGTVYGNQEWSETPITK